MFHKAKNDNYSEALPGILRKTLVYGEQTLLAEFRLQAGRILPLHAHLYEQTGYLVAGRLRFTIGAERFEAGPGDSWCVPANVPHAAEVLEDAVAIEVFSPLREDYLPPAAG